MKKLLLFLSMSLWFCAQAQDLEKCGLDSNPILTEDEAEYLNKHLVPISIKDWKFREGYKVLFVTGLRGEEIGNKVDFFKYAKKKAIGKDSAWLQELIPEFILIDSEQSLSSDYAVIVTYWVKVFSKSRKRKILRKLARRQRKKFKHE